LRSAVTIAALLIAGVAVSMGQAPTDCGFSPQKVRGALPLKKSLSLFLPPC